MSASVAAPEPGFTSKVEEFMSRPQAFQQSHVALRNLPYAYADGSLSEPSDLGGVLGSGQIVWTEQAFASRVRPSSAVGFVEGIGMVHVDPRWLTCVSGKS